MTLAADAPRILAANVDACQDLRTARRAKAHRDRIPRGAIDMFDVCLVTEGAWPARTGGLASWTHYVLRALDGADTAVVSLGRGTRASREFTVPRSVRSADLVTRVGRVPDARLYLASGLDAAEQLLRARPTLASRTVYVEHGDAVREVLYGASATEGGRAVPRGDRRTLARSVHAQRRAIAQSVDSVIGVTPRTTRRVRRESRARAVCIANAVPGPAVNALPPIGPRRLGYVGRFTRIKGIDRFVALARSLDTRSLACGLPVGERISYRGDRVEWRLHPRELWPREVGVLAMPSRLEASPFAALEAEAQGIPVLLSSVAHLRASRLIERVPWCRGAWAARVNALLAQGPDPAHGARLAELRWARFEQSWRRVVAR